MDPWCIAFSCNKNALIQTHMYYMTPAYGISSGFRFFGHSSLRTRKNVVFGLFVLNCPRCLEKTCSHSLDDVTNWSEMDPNPSVLNYFLCASHKGKWKIYLHEEFAVVADWALCLRCSTAARLSELQRASVLVAPSPSLLSGCLLPYHLHWSKIVANSEGIREW